MAIKSSGEIGISDIQAEFGGSGSLSEYYRGGGLVPDKAINNLVPTSGEIGLAMFYGAVADTSQPTVFTVTFGIASADAGTTVAGQPAVRTSASISGSSGSAASNAVRTSPSITGTGGVTHTNASFSAITYTPRWTWVGGSRFCKTQDSYTTGTKSTIYDAADGKTYDLGAEFDCHAAGDGTNIYAMGKNAQFNRQIQYKTSPTSGQTAGWNVGSACRGIWRAGSYYYVMKTSGAMYRTTTPTQSSAWTSVGSAPNGNQCIWQLANNTAVVNDAGQPDYAFFDGSSTTGTSGTLPDDLYCVSYDTSTGTYHAFCKNSTSTDHHTSSDCINWTYQATASSTVASVANVNTSPTRNAVAVLNGRFYFWKGSSFRTSTTWGGSYTTIATVSGASYGTCVTGGGYIFAVGYSSTSNELAAWYGTASSGASLTSFNMGATVGNRSTFSLGGGFSGSGTFASGASATAMADQVASYITSSVSGWTASRSGTSVVATKDASGSYSTNVSWTINAGDGSAGGSGTWTNTANGSAPPASWSITGGATSSGTFAAGLSGTALAQNIASNFSSAGWSASASGSNLVLTRTTDGVYTTNVSLSITNNSGSVTGAGTLTSTSNGVDAVSPVASSFTVSGAASGSYTWNATDASGTAVAQRLRDNLTVSGWTISGSGADVVFTSNGLDDYSLTFSGTSGNGSGNLGTSPWSANKTQTGSAT